MNVQDIISKTNGKAFTVCFTKKDGSERVLTGRTDVRKHLKGGVATYNGRGGGKGNIGVYEMKRGDDGRWTKGAYKCFNEHSVKWIKAGGKTYDFR